MSTSEYSPKASDEKKPDGMDKHGLAPGIYEIVHLNQNNAQTLVGYVRIVPFTATVNDLGWVLQQSFSLPFVLTNMHSVRFRNYHPFDPEPQSWSAFKSAVQSHHNWSVTNDFGSREIEMNSYPPD